MRKCDFHVSALNDEQGTYFGVLVGRYANRIASGRFSIDGNQYQVTTNNNGNALHGGLKGWNKVAQNQIFFDFEHLVHTGQWLFKVVWDHEINGNQLILKHTSQDGDQGFPGTVDVQVTFDVTDEGEVVIKYSASTRDKATPINLTSHPYFNLGGEGSGNISSHNVTIYADKYTAIDANLIPTGCLKIQLKPSIPSFDLLGLAIETHIFQASLHQ